MAGRTTADKERHMRIDISRQAASAGGQKSSVSYVSPLWLSSVCLLWLAATGAVPLSAQAQRPLPARAVALDLVCGAQAALAAPPQAIRILAGAEPRRALFSSGDAVLINAGTSQGLRAGQHFYVRRVVTDRFAAKTGDSKPFSIHTAGWVTIAETQADVSVATIAESCDGILEGDYLEPLVMSPAAPAGAAGEPDFARPARVILGDERRQLGSPGSLMVIDRGSDHGLRPGQRLTLFRETLNGRGPVMTLGEAVVASTQHETSMVRIGRTNEEVQVGDLIAIHR